MSEAKKIVSRRARAFAAYLEDEYHLNLSPELETKIREEFWNALTEVVNAFDAYEERHGYSKKWSE